MMLARMEKQESYRASGMRHDAEIIFPEARSILTGLFFIAL